MSLVFFLAHACRQALPCGGCLMQLRLRKNFIVFVCVQHAGGRDDRAEDLDAHAQHRRGLQRNGPRLAAARAARAEAGAGVRLTCRLPAYWMPVVCYILEMGYSFFWAGLHSQFLLIATADTSFT